ncbi:MAG: hypothetical protein MK384_00540 [SAR202 cluster bacterium]|nr:hypothetical protein [SAR202 cluster bacterium]
MRSKLRILFVLRWSYIFTYHESTIRELCKRGYDVEVLFDEVHSAGDAGTAVMAAVSDHVNLSWGWSLRRIGIWRKPVFVARELLTYASYLGRPEQDEYYIKRWEKYLPAYIQRLVTSWIGRLFLKSKLGRWVLKKFIEIVPSDRAICASLREWNPDVVIASPSNMKYSEEIEYVKAAKTMGIPTVIAVLSWDNLTTKGLLHETPAATLVWNRAQQAEAVSIHDIPKDMTVVTGAPFLDKWFDDVPVMEEKTFRRLVNIDHDTPFVLYLGSSANIARNESWLVAALASRLARSNHADIKILARAHGGNSDIFEELSMSNVTVWDRSESLPDSRESLMQFAAALRYSVCAVGLNTTAMVDALLMDSPVITLLVPEYADTNASKAVHFSYLLDAGVYLKVKDTDEFMAGLELILQGKDLTQVERQQFKLDFIRPYGMDISAGSVAATAIEMTAKRRPPSEIGQIVSKRRDGKGGNLL